MDFHLIGILFYKLLADLSNYLEEWNPGKFAGFCSPQPEDIMAPQIIS